MPPESCINGRRLGGAAYQRLRLCSVSELFQEDRRLFARVDDPELWSVLGALPERGQEIELFLRASSTEPDRDKADPDAEELQPEQHQDLSPDRELPGQWQEHEDDGGSEKAEKGRLPVFHRFAVQHSSAG
jgi:MoxR-like ATPase